MPPENEKGPLLEGIYRTRLKTQPPAEWKDLGKEERTAKMRDGVIKFWSSSDVLLRQLGLPDPVEVTAIALLTPLGATAVKHLTEVVGLDLETIITQWRTMVTSMVDGLPRS